MQIAFLLLLVFAYVAWRVLAKRYKCRLTRRDDSETMLPPARAGHDWSKKK